MFLQSMKLAASDLACQISSTIPWKTKGKYYPENGASVRHANSSDDLSDHNSYL